VQTLEHEVVIQQSVVLRQTPKKRQDEKKISADTNMSQNVTAVMIGVYVAVQILMPFSHDFTPVIKVIWR